MSQPVLQLAAQKRTDRNAAARLEINEELKERTHWHAWAAGGLLLVALLWQIVAALRPIPWICAQLTSDDTFLTLQVSANWARYGFPTFDGLHRTNGFQALWGILTWLLAQLAHEHTTLLRATLILAAALNTITGLVLFRLARQTAGNASAAWVAAFWTMFCLSGRPALIGLENALTGALAALALQQIHHLLGAPRSTRAWFFVAALLAALCWARLDAAVICLVALLGLSGLAWRQRAWRGFALAGFVVLTLGAALIAFNLWAGGTPTPISGMVKRHVARGIEPAWTFAVAARGIGDSLLLLIKSSSAGTGTLWPPALSSVARVFIVLVLVVAVARRRVVVNAWIGLWAAGLFGHALAIRLWLSGYYADTLWYYAPEHVATCLWVGVACGRTFGRHAGPRGQLLWPLALASARLAAAVFTLSQTPTGETVSQNRLAAAAWLREHVAQDERVGSWNAGELAYFSQRTVVNLDGLVNDREYLERIKARRTGQELLDSQHITWIADYAQNLAWLSRDRWEEAAHFGEAPEAKQLVLRRKPVPP